MLAPTRAPICTKCQTEVVVWAAKVMRGPLDNAARKALAIIKPDWKPDDGS